MINIFKYRMSDTHFRNIVGKHNLELISRFKKHFNKKHDENHSVDNGKETESLNSDKQDCIHEQDNQNNPNYMVINPFNTLSDSFNKFLNIFPNTFAFTHFLFPIRSLVKRIISKVQPNENSTLKKVLFNLACSISPHKS